MRNINSITTELGHYFISKVLTTRLGEKLTISRISEEKGIYTLWSHSSPYVKGHAIASFDEKIVNSMHQEAEPVKFPFPRD